MYKKIHKRLISKSPVKGCVPQVLFVYKCYLYKQAACKRLLLEIRQWDDNLQQFFFIQSENDRVSKELME